VLPWGQVLVLLQVLVLEQPRQELP